MDRDPRLRSWSEDCCLARPLRFWFQSFRAVMGLDWHSSGITTSVIGALKRGLAPLEPELGVHVCGGRGRFSRQTPHELLSIIERVGFDGSDTGLPRDPTGPNERPGVLRTRVMLGRGAGGPEAQIKRYRGTQSGQRMGGGPKEK
jgi:hypothetical protein